MLRSGLVQYYHDPVQHGINDFQELSNTYHQIALERTRTLHRLLTHYLPLYFPEIESHFHSPRSEWLLRLLIAFPTPGSICAISMTDFVAKALTIVGRKIDKQRLLEDIYRTAKESIGLPVPLDSQAVAMFRLVLQEMLSLSQLRDQIEQSAHQQMEQNPDYVRLRQIPGIGPVGALAILAEAGDLRRFAHYRQFLKFCGFDLSTHQSCQFRGASKLSKHGNARLRCVFWMAPRSPSE